MSLIPTQPSSWQRIAGSTGVPYVPGNALEILNNGDAFYPRMLDESVRRAHASICMEACGIDWGGEVGDEFAAALAERARAGVRVMILLDAVGSSNIGDRTLKTLDAGGCQVVSVQPDQLEDPRPLQQSHPPKVFDCGRRRRLHRRRRHRGSAAWRRARPGRVARHADRSEGPAVRWLQSGFAHNWQESTGELVRRRPVRTRTPMHVENTHFRSC